MFAMVRKAFASVRESRGDAGGTEFRVRVIIVAFGHSFVTSVNSHRNRASAAILVILAAFELRLLVACQKCQQPPGGVPGSCDPRNFCFLWGGLERKVGGEE